MKPYVTPGTMPEKTRQWLDRVAPYNRSQLELRADRAALLVIDMQRFFVDQDGPAFTCGAEAILPNVTTLVSAFRRAQQPVVFTRHVHHPSRLDAGIMEWWWEGMCVEGSPESEIHPDLAPRDDEKVVLKHRYSAFFDTDLATVLRCLKVEDLVITGTMTNMCCESTARDAYYRDYRVFFPADANGAVSEEMHLASLLNLAYGFACITTTERIVAALSMM